MAANYTSRDGKTKPRPTRFTAARSFQTEKRREDLLPHLFRDTGAAVAYLDDDIVGAGLQGDGGLAAILDRVIDQIREGAAERNRLGAVGQPAGGLELDPMPGIGHIVAQALQQR